MQSVYDKSQNWPAFQVERRKVKLPRYPSNDFSISLFGGTYATQNFGASAGTGLRAGYHITEDVFVEATFGAYFTREEDISQDAVLQAICSAVGIDANAFMQGIARPDIKEQLKSNTEEAIARGAFGVPTFFIGEDMYFGNDRLALVRSALLRGKT